MKLASLTRPTGWGYIGRAVGLARVLDLFLDGGFLIQKSPAGALTLLSLEQEEPCFALELAWSEAGVIVNTYRGSLRSEKRCGNCLAKLRCVPGLSVECTR